jgi:hypothetical protein
MHAAAAPLTSSPPASASSAPASAVRASPIATGPAGLDRYGLIVGSSVRSEGDAQTIAAVQNPLSAAVSPDGRRIAYGQVLRGGGEARLLWLLDSAALTQPRIVHTLTDSETAAVSTGGGVVWSSDGSSVLIGINSTAYESAGPVDAGRYTYAALREVRSARGQFGRSRASIARSRSVRSRSTAAGT